MVHRQIERARKPRRQSAVGLAWVLDANELLTAIPVTAEIGGGVGSFPEAWDIRLPEAVNLR